MKFKITVLLVAVSMFFSTNVYAAVIGTANDEVQQYADPILDNILQSLADDDYPQYTKDFDRQLRAMISRKSFIVKRKEIFDWVGGYLYREYLGFINTQGVTVVFWKGTFDRTQDDVLIRITLTKEQGRILVKGLFYQ